MNITRKITHHIMHLSASWVPLCVCISVKLPSLQAGSTQVRSQKTRPVNTTSLPASSCLDLYSPQGSSHALGVHGSCKENTSRTLEFTSHPTFPWLVSGHFTAGNLIASIIASIYEEAMDPSSYVAWELVHLPSQCPLRQLSILHRLKKTATTPSP